MPSARKLKLGVNTPPMVEDWLSVQARVNGSSNYKASLLSRLCSIINTVVVTKTFCVSSSYPPLAEW